MYVNMIQTAWVVGLCNMGEAGHISSILLCIAGLVLTAIISYLLGSLNFGILISKYKYHQDIRQFGSGNAGMTNMLRTLSLIHI